MLPRVMIIVDNMMTNYLLSDKVRMGFLVNYSPSGAGIDSVLSDNMVCTCDALSCHCAHKYYTTQRVTG